MGYNKNDMARMAGETQFLRDNLEKVLRLTDVLRFMRENAKLRDCLVLKGGTAINLTVFAMPRLSVDIDLDFHKDCSREEMMACREEINREIGAYMSSQGYQLSPSTKNPHSLDSWVFFYLNAAGNRDNIKIEINYSMRQHVLEPERRGLTVGIVEPLEVLTLAPVELFGSKIKALVERHTSRDLYDVYRLLHSELFGTMDVAMLRKIVVFYMAVGGSREPSVEWDLEPIRQIKFAQIRATLLPMLKKGDGFDFEAAKVEVVRFLEELMRLTEDEKAFVEAFRAKDYRPELLFDDAEVVERVRRHPMAAWKVR